MCCPTCEVSELFVGLCCRILGLWFLYGFIFQDFRSLIRLWVYKSHMSSLISLWVCVSQDIMSRLIYACTSLFSWILALSNIHVSVPSESVSHWVIHVWLCNPRFLCPWDSLGKNTGVGCHFLLQGIFLTQGLNLGLMHCRQILYHLSHLGSLWLC